MLAQTSYVRRRAGSVSSAWLDWGTAGVVKNRAQKGRTAAQNAGLRFEAKVSAELYRCFPGFLAQVPFAFVSDYSSEKCILDGMVFWDQALASGEMLLVEIKSRHNGDGWFQLRYLYLPVVAKTFPNKKLRLLEICKSYEPVKLPEGGKLWPSVEAFLKSKDSYGIVAWK